jgi:putative membrane protein
MNITLHWHTEPLLLIVIVGASWLYALACGPWRRQLAPDLKSYPLWPSVRFHLGVLLGYIAVGSPLDQLGEGFLFTAHMAQHMLLIYLAAPLIVSGIPPQMLDPFLEARPRLTRVLRVLVHPLFAGLIFNLSFSVWHFPELYELALRNRTVHIIEHWMMFLPALLMTWPLVSRSKILPRISYGGMMVYSFALMVADLPLWAALIFAENPIYETYTLAPRITWMTASQDMILGAVIMKAFNEVFSLSTMGWAFFAWYRRDR